MFTKYQNLLLFILLLGLLPYTQAENNFDLTLKKTGDGTIVSTPTGINCGTSCRATYSEETIVKITAIAKTGWEFNAWSGSCTGTSNPTYVIMNNGKVCTASFSQLPAERYDLTVVKTDHGKITSEPLGINCGTTCTAQYDDGKSVILRANPDDGYTFGGWGGDCGSSMALSLPVDMNASKTCTASFQLLPFKLIVKKDGSGTGRIASNVVGINCGEICEANYEKGKEVILTAESGENSQFSGWGGDCIVLSSTLNSAKVTLDDEKACTATFELLPHNLKVTKIGNGIIISQPSGIDCGTSCVSSYGHGTEITLTATPDKDYEFIGWTGSCGEAPNKPTDKSATVTIDNDRSCTAQFKRLPVELTITKNGNGKITSEGIDCGTKCTESYEYGEDVVLTATPDADHEFSGWQGDCEYSSTSLARVTLFTAQNCTAYFTPLPPEGRYNLTVITKGEGQGTLTSNPEGIDKCETVCTTVYDEDITVRLTATLQAGSLFKEWDEDCFGATETCSDISGATACSTSVTLIRSKTCVAKFELEAPLYEVTATTSGDGFGTIKSDLPGIDCDECKAYFQKETTVTLTALPQINSIFTGWINNCSGTNQSVSVTIEKAITCTAVFEILPVYNFTIKSIGNGHGGVVSDIEGVSCGDSCTQYPKDARITFTAKPETDSKFMMWGGECTGTESPLSILLDGAKECTALFELKPRHNFTVTHIGGGKGKVERDREGLNCGDDCRAHFEGETVILTATAEEGSQFTEWGGHCSGTESPFAIIIDDSKTCTANFEPLPTYELTAQKIGDGTITSDPEGIDCGETCSRTYFGDTVITLTATPNIGSRFTSWAGDCTGETSSFTVTMDAAKNCTANFEVLPPSTLTVTKAGTGSGVVVVEPSLGPMNCAEITCTEAYSANTEVTLTATPTNIDFAFSGWSGDCASADTVITMTLDTNKTCIANFERQAPPAHHNLSVTTLPNNGVITSEPIGINCGTTCTVALPENTVITLTPTPNDGFVFTRWSGDCASPAYQLPVVMNMPKVCMAHFVAAPPPGSHYLTVVKTGEGTISSDMGDIDCGNECTVLYPEGTTVTLTAKPQSFTQFTGWSGNCIGTDLEATVSLTSPQTCTANFDPVPSSVQFLIPEYRVNEIEGKAEIRVTRAASKRGAIAVNYITTDISATAGMDYLAVSGTLSWADGDMTPKSIEIPLLLDALEEGDENLNITLTEIAGPTTLGKLSVATITIVDTPSDGAGAVQFSSPQYAINETSGEATISVDRIGGKNSTVSVNYAALDETALAETDYTLESNTLIWRDGDAQSKTFSVQINTDAEPETEETLILKLSNPLGGALLGANKTAILKIIDSLGNPDTLLSPGILQFTAPNHQVAEDSGDLTLTVSRTEGSHGPVTVSYSAQDENTTVGSDYVATSGILNWMNGEADNKNIIVSIIPDTLGEPDETFTVNLSNPTGNASLGAIPITYVMIDDLGTPITMLPPGPARGILQFVETNYQIGENEGGLTIIVTRTEGSDGDIKVNYTTKDKTATEQDYIATQGTLLWLNEEEGEKSFDIDISNDILVEGNEEILIELSEPTGGAKLGTNAQATLTITDDDVTLIQFSSSNYLVNENGKSTTITVSRQGGRIGEVSVQYETIDDCQSSPDNCAIANKDYIPVSGTLKWHNSQKGDRTFTIPLLDDREEEGNEIISLKLSILTDNAQFGTPNQAEVIIVDNESGECEPFPIVDCLLNNEGNTLSNINISESGTVIGGQLNGQIGNNGGLLQDISLGANARLTGGIIRGNIKGISPENPPILLDIEIAANSTLAHLIVGNGSVIHNSVKIGKGVFFESNSLIPYMADLNESLGRISISGLKMEAIKLTSDVLLHSNINGIVSAINGLHELKDANLTLRQNPDNGYLTLDIEPSIHYAVLPVQVRQVWRTDVESTDSSPRLGLTVNLDGEVIFITHTGREIKTLPVVQEPQTLREALSILGLNQMTMLSNGNLEIPISNEAYYMARPNLFSEILLDNNLPNNNIPLGINGIGSPWLSNVTDVFLVFEAHENEDIELSETDFLSEISQDRDTLSSESPLILRQQFMYPAAADSEALYTLSGSTGNQTALCSNDGQRTELYNDGRICIYMGKGQQKKAYKGVLDYFVIKGSPPQDGNLQIEIAEDFNQDGNKDYRIIYPNGDRQNMFQCPNCFD
ncbi:Calx-beta domain-containing protein [Candidatus Parabeggiatoa sp. HSG14]|uniref:InlB B-repeat-containing protein n=1 Tax=Candidatus Parabeggiatoa sp. HSG14 TaxID=3055593 RepID=UPI0025A6C14B|nr:Calx-beta domain-containing protein [Thiotrichales bacterium HSG14]